MLPLYVVKAFLDVVLMHASVNNKQDFLNQWWEDIKDDVRNVPKQHIIFIPESTVVRDE
jgi:hypothetical protein